jgi:hypothetical protein
VIARFEPEGDARAILLPGERRSPPPFRPLSELLARGIKWVHDPCCLAREARGRAPDPCPLGPRASGRSALRLTRNNEGKMPSGPSTPLQAPGPSAVLRAGYRLSAAISRGSGSCSCGEDRPGLSRRRRRRSRFLRLLELKWELRLTGTRAQVSSPPARVPVETDLIT